MATGSEHPDASPATEDGEEDSEDEMMVVEIDATGTAWWYTVGHWFSDKGEVWIEAPPEKEKKKGRNEPMLATVKARLSTGKCRLSAA